MTHTQTGHIHHQAATDYHLTAGDNIRFDAGRNIELSTGRSFKIDTDKDVQITVKGQGASYTTARKNLTIQAAQSIRVQGQGGGDITVHQNGGGFTIKPDGKVELFGKTVVLGANGGLRLNGKVNYSVPAPASVDAPATIAPLTRQIIPPVSLAGVTKHAVEEPQEDDKNQLSVLKIRFLEDGRSFSSRAFTSSVPAASQTGVYQTDINGGLQFEVTPGISRIEFNFPQDDIRVMFNVKKLEPVNDIKGLQTRLYNLAFYRGEINGKLDQRTCGAIRRFQNAVGLPDLLAATDRSQPQASNPIDASTCNEIETFYEKDHDWQDDFAKKYRDHRSQARFEYNIALDQLNTIDLYNPPYVMIDAHMHINSGRCAPMPILTTTVPRGTLEFFTPVVSKNLSAKRISTQTTEQIGNQAATDNATTFKNKALYPHNPKYETVTPMMVMPMDMEFAHIDGYKGEPIYKTATERYRILQGRTAGRKLYLTPQKARLVRTERWNGKKYYKNHRVIREEGDFFWYFDRKSEKDKGRDAKWLHADESDLYENWTDQILRTELAVLQNPWRLLPMFHYDPRRYQLDSEEQEKSRKPAYYWARPFDELVKPPNETNKNSGGLFFGFKMYTALGYKPSDWQKLPRLEDFYTRCQSEDIPVLCHCSPGGVTAADQKHYFELEPDPKIKARYSRFYNDDEKKYFYENFVHPKAWLPVLAKYPDLKLCLAHFGGNGDDWKDWSTRNTGNLTAGAGFLSKDYLIKSVFEDDKECRWIKGIIALMVQYPNLYTDISFHLLKQSSRELAWLLQHHPDRKRIKNRILFGTDWWMTTLDNYGYQKYCDEAKKRLDDLSDQIGEDLWILFAEVNPMRFFGVKEKTYQFSAALKKAEKDAERMLQKENEGTEKKEKRKKVITQS